MLLEKPIAQTVAEAERLVHAADVAGARILIGHHRARSPIMAKARRVVESGVLGRLVAVMGSATFVKPDHHFVDGPWRAQPGGALGSFLLSDTAACARSWEQTSQKNKAYPSYADEDCYVIAGTDGSLSVPTMRLKTYPRAQDRSWWKPFEVGVVGMVRDDPIRLQMEHFGAVVRGQAQPLVSARDGLANLRVTEAIVEAARSGGRVELA